MAWLGFVCYLGWETKTKEASKKAINSVAHTSAKID